jgi:uncharacterized membrane protein HdeD (DUF308 family)
MSSTRTPFETGRSGLLPRIIGKLWQLLLAEGIILLALGVAAIAVPQIASFVTTVFIGVVLFAAGVVGLVSTFGGRELPGFWWSLISALLSIIAGGILVWNPALGIVSLTAVMTAFFIADGILTIVLSLRHRSRLVGRWQWLLVNGVLDLIIAGLIIWGLPGTLAWALGLFVGIDLLFGGIALIAISLGMRQQMAGQPHGIARHAT